MSKKVFGLLTSVRFWIIVLTTVLAILNGADPVDAVRAGLAAVVALGTLDSVATRVGGGK